MILKLKSDKKKEKAQYDTYWKGTIRIIPEEKQENINPIKKWFLKFCEFFF